MSRETARNIILSICLIVSFGIASYGMMPIVALSKASGKLNIGTTFSYARFFFVYAPLLTIIFIPITIKFAFLLFDSFAKFLNGDANN
ncbi:MAG: hypothetical protein HQ474_01660 [Flammeovirgaceae bacterium]|nr:hypothetical protein [Flammeovirgaceae bacterium]